jgi:hypothetical protein
MTKITRSKTIKNPETPSQSASLGRMLSTNPRIQQFNFWIVGDSPLIVHAWSEKAKREILSKQTKSLRGEGRDVRDPEQEFKASLYEIGPDKYGFPAMAVKNAIVDECHKDKGVPREHARRALWIQAPFYKVAPAKAGAMCDMPLFRIYGSKPEMREDMVKIGMGTAALAYRGQFTTWAMNVIGRVNVGVITMDSLSGLVDMGGAASGIGEWRNDRNGMFGAFHLARPEEEEAWKRFAAGKGPLPQPSYMAEAAE